MFLSFLLVRHERGPLSHLRSLKCLKEELFLFAARSHISSVFWSRAVLTARKSMQYIPKEEWPE